MDCEFVEGDIVWVECLKARLIIVDRLDDIYYRVTPVDEGVPLITLFVPSLSLRKLTPLEELL
jgi:hypothetical protein